MSVKRRNAVAYVGHHVKLERHSDDVESNDAGDAEVEVLAADDDVNDESWLGVARPVGQLTQACGRHSNALRAAVSEYAVQVNMHVKQQRD